MTKLFDRKHKRNRESSRSVRVVFEALAVAIITLSVACASIWGLWRSGRETSLRQQRDELERLALIVASQIDTNAHDAIRDPESTNDAQYKVAVEPMRLIKRSCPDVAYIYTCVLQDNEVHFVLDAADPGDSDGDGVEDQSGVWELYEDFDPSMMMAFGATGSLPKSSSTPEPYSDQWGTFMTGYAPFYRANGSLAGVVGVDMSVGKLAALEAVRARQSLMGLIPASALALMIGTMTFFLRRRQRADMQALDRARQRADRLAEIARRTSNAVIITDKVGHIEWVNEAFSRSTGYSLDEVKGKSPGSVLRGERTDPDTSAIFRKAIAEGKSCSGELVNYRKSGEEFVSSIEIEPLFDAQGRHSGFMGVNADVTEQRRLEASVRASEQRLTAMFEAMAEGVIKIDPSGVVASANAAVDRILGFSTNTVVGMTIAELCRGLTDLDDIPVDPSRHPAAIALGTGVSVLHAVMKFHRTSKDSIWLRMNCEVVFGPESQIEGVVLSITDVTVEREATERLATERARLAAFVDHAPAAIAMFDSEMRYIAVSQKWMSDYKLEGVRVIGRTHYDVFPNVPEAWREIHARCMQGAIERCEDDVWRPDGWDIDQHLQWEVRPWHRSDSSIGGIMMFTQDITAHVEAEIAMRQQAEMLAALNQQLETIATRDPLTHLWNRRQFLEDLNIAVKTRRRRKHRMSVFFLDLDNFKYINDSLGHEAGDQLLKQVADRMRESVRETDVVARLGGDEFAVLVRDFTNDTDVYLVADRIVEAMQRPFELLDRQVSATTSLGLVIASDDETVEGLLQNADLAMYHAKNGGKSRWKEYEPWMSDATNERIAFETDLRQGWANQQFSIVFQPIVDLTSGACYDVEALLRWKHPIRGHVSPAEFIPLAEEIGLIGPIGEWVLEESCVRMMNWRREHPSISHVKMAVNVSGRQIKEPDFVDRVRAILARTGIPPGDLILEVTESMAVSETNSGRTTLEELRGLGILIAIDDFGTGYSSMGSLATMPVDIVKIDRSFVVSAGDSIEAAAILRSLVMLCRVLGLKVVAEGIEIEDQFVQLHSVGCDLAQGYLFSKPLPEAELLTWFRERGESRAA